MKTPLFKAIKGVMQSAGQWLTETPERALDDAYDAALRIRAIENEHFNGQKVSPESASHSDSVQAYFQAELNKNLNQARQKLSEFKLTRSFVENAPGKTPKTILFETPASPPDWRTRESKEKELLILEKLNFIDEVLSRYSPEKVSSQPTAAPPSPTPSTSLVPYNSVPIESASKPAQNSGTSARSSGASRVKASDTMSETSFLPRSILRTLDRLKRELDPKSEEEVVKTFRSSKTKTVVSLKFILLLILIPLLTHQISKNFIVGPIVDRVRDTQHAKIFINEEMEEEAFSELQHFENRLKFKMLVGSAPQLTREEMEEKVKEEAEEIAEEFRRESSSAIKNVFSDLLSLFAFGFVIANSQREITVLKSFMDNIVYGLSDSAKAFIIILFTDIFVGFHSPHGWEVILEGISRHLGIPENHAFIFLFIATFPVILDTVFKYWIFRYLNRISPSAVATYKNMNE
ncbi:MAG: proton extrusion protein PcxA [Oscillatoria princeps RMCB-10]|nr:proton extrusion protein PcxA [Oscillatoria princeps RMCB-10]